MHISVEPREDHAILHLRGEFDTYYVPHLQKEIDDLAKAGIVRVVLNLRLVKFINSTALGAIIKASKSLGAKSGKLALSRPSAFCRDIIEKVGLDRVVGVFDTDEAAVESFDAWLRGIAEHLCLDWHRGRGRAKRLPFDTSSDRTTPDPAQLAAPADENEQLRQRIQELPPELQEVLYLHYYDQMSYDEMAGWLGVARATVNERLAKARGLLRVRLSSSGGRADAR